VKRELVRGETKVSTKSKKDSPGIKESKNTILTKKTDRSEVSVRKEES